MENEIAVIEKLAGFDEKIKSLVTQSGKAEIGTMEICEKAGDLGKLIQTQLKKLEEERKSWVKPLNGQVTRLNTMFKERSAPLEKAKALIKEKISTFLRAEKKRKEEEAAEETRKAEKIALDAATKAEDKGDDATANAILETAAEVTSKPQEKTIARGGLGSSTSMRANWVHEVLDPDLIPSKYLMVNESAVKAAIKSGVREIPGIKIWNDEQAVIR